MTLVKRFRVFGHTVSFFRGQCCGVCVAAVLDGVNGELAVEIVPADDDRRLILRYLRDEGILGAAVDDSGFLAKRSSV